MTVFVYPFVYFVILSSLKIGEVVLFRFFSICIGKQSPPQTSPKATTPFCDPIAGSGKATQNAVALLGAVKFTDLSRLPSP
jgi:hypothetical protein